MASGSSDQVRSIALEKYVRPAILSGRTHFSVAVKDLMKDLRGKGFPVGNYPQICTAIRTGKFLKENGIEIEGIDGPPSGLSTTVVVRYRVSNPSTSAVLTDSTLPPDSGQLGESPSSEAVRLMEGLRGLLKAELSEYGGGEAFLRWIRSEDEIPPASGAVL